MPEPNPRILEKLSPEAQERYKEDMLILTQREREYAYEKKCLQYLPKREKSHCVMPCLSDLDEDDWE